MDDQAGDKLNFCFRRAGPRTGCTEEHQWNQAVGRAVDRMLEPKLLHQLLQQGGEDSDMKLHGVPPPQGHLGKGGGGRERTQV